jgi:1,2-diacylglycerol 3-alpha-glucosyltransferase
LNVGIVSKWFNRGQPVVGRYLRSGVDQLGHRSFVLAKPRREKGPMGGALERTGVWDQPDVTAASSFETPLEEYLAWIEENSIEVILCDQNYQFEELAQLRARGVKVIGRFVWEHFTSEHLNSARAAYDLIYSVTECERERYLGWGLETPRVRWGIHPELLSIPTRRSTDGLVRFVFPGGFLGHRKPAEPVIEAFSRAAGDNLRLLVKAQVERSRLERILPLVEADGRIELRLADEPWQRHLENVAANDVSISPSRWEGLGLPLYEAIAFGMPTITNDDPPMNEVVLDEDNGLLVPSHPDGTARSGIPAKRPDPDALTAAIERLAEPPVLDRLRGGAEASRERHSWDRTLAGIAALLDG